MLIKDVVKHGVQLKDVETNYIHAERKHDKVDSEFEITADLEGEVIDDHKGKTIIHIIVSNNDFSVEIKKIGYFVFDQQIENERDAILFLEVQGVRILWSYAREDIYTITGKMLPKPLMLPTIDVMKTLEKVSQDEN